MTDQVRDLLTGTLPTTEPVGEPRAAEGGRHYEEERTMPVRRGDSGAPTTDNVRPLPVGAGLAPPADDRPGPSTAGRASPSPTTADEQPVGADDPPCGTRKTDRDDADLRFSDRCGNSAFAASAPGGAKAQFPGAPQTTDSVRPSPVGAGLAPPADDRPAGEEHPSSAPAGHLPPRGKAYSESARERASSDDLRAHLASLAVQAESLRAEIPGFSLRQALTDPDFLRMTSPAVGLSVRRAWYALHGAELRRAAAEQSALALTGSLVSGALRPREGGRGLAAGTLSGSDPRRWSREQRESVRRRVLEAAARGEKIYPEG